MQDRTSPSLHEALGTTEKASVPTFDYLAEQRSLLQDFCRLHIESLRYFQRHLSFKVNAIEPNREIKPQKASHLTSSATCYESVGECPERFRPEQSADYLMQVQTKFANAAAARPDWKSEDSAGIYCRCRALPFVIRQMSRWSDRIDRHLGIVFEQLNMDEDRGAIGEADPRDDPRFWYPPNAYHTFWTLEAISALEKRFPKEFKQVNSSLRLEQRQRQLHLWAEHRLSYQVALHSSGSALLDSDQLAWSLAIFLREPTHYESKVEKQDLVRHAFHCLFSTQQRVGTWSHYGPLFHYKEAGNAYCYVFETFAWLLKQALRPKAEIIRLILREHCDKLVKLWEYGVVRRQLFFSLNDN